MPGERGGGGQVEYRARSHLAPGYSGLVSLLVLCRSVASGQDVTFFISPPKEHAGAYTCVSNKVVEQIAPLRGERGTHTFSVETNPSSSSFGLPNLSQMMVS